MLTLVDLFEEVTLSKRPRLGGNALKKVYKLLLVFYALNIMDYSTTMVAISHGAVEGNPIADYFVSYDALHYFKLVGVGLVCTYLIHVGI